MRTTGLPPSRSFPEEDRPKLRDRYLQMAREDPDLKVRNVSWRALAGGWGAPDIRAMKACLADESLSADERCGALQSLAVRESDSAEVRRRILEFYDQPPPPAS